MKKNERLVLAATLALSAGCAAKLTVYVDVYDGSRPIPLAQQVAFANYVLDRSSPEERVKAAKSNVVDEVKERAPDLDTKAVSELKLDTLLGDDAMVEIVEQKDDDKDGEGSLTAAEHARRFLMDCNPDDRFKRYRSKNKLRKDRRACEDRFAALRIAAIREEQAIIEASKKVEDKLRSLLEDATTPKLKELRAQVGEVVERHFRPWNGRGIAASAMLDGRSVGSPLFDPMVGALARASSPLRRKTRTLRVGDRRAWIPFSRSRFSSAGGNSQFVVVREGHLVFHQKSLDFDPTPVIGAGVATTKLGLEVASALASAYGVPMPKGSAKAPASTMTASDEEITRLEDELDARNDRARAFMSRLASLYEQLEQSSVSTEQLEAIRAQLARELELFSREVR